jgi:extracellular factor (EF) 3-hydroxypalmitic acid methyl ester biosynthesis protein
VCRPHPIRAALQEDPFTARSVAKPRGYPGDAVLVDYIYDGLPPELAARTSSLGQRIFAYTAGCSESARSVRWRRDHVAQAIDAVAARVHRPRILSVACGHLSEASCSEAVRSGAVSEYVALDHDEQTLQELRLAHPEACIVPQRATVRDLLAGRCDLGTFDLIYSAGLYDYLRQPVAQALTATLFRGLEAGGQLLIGNFVPDFGTAGYMEAFMDWHLIGRGPVDMEDLCASVPAYEVAKRWQCLWPWSWPASCLGSCWCSGTFWPGSW